MNEVLRVGSATLGGFALGAFFFVGLWWTVRRGVTSAQPAVIFLGSMLFRTLAVMVGFYSLSRGDWRNVVGSLLGFVLARSVVTKMTSRLPQAQRPITHGGAR